MPCSQLVGQSPVALAINRTILPSCYQLGQRNLLLPICGSPRGMQRPQWPSSVRVLTPSTASELPLLDPASIAQATAHVQMMLIGLKKHKELRLGDMTTGTLCLKLAEVKATIQPQAVCSQDSGGPSSAPTMTDSTSGLGHVARRLHFVPCPREQSALKYDIHESPIPNVENETSDLSSNVPFNSHNSRNGTVQQFRFLTPKLAD